MIFKKIINRIELRLDNELLEIRKKTIKGGDMAEEGIIIKMVPIESCRRCIWDCTAIFEKHDIRIDPRVLLFMSISGDDGYTTDGCTTYLAGKKKYKSR